MTKELSALLDGELEVHEAPTLWASLRANPSLRGTWQGYQLISDTLRNEGGLTSDITARVMAAVSEEPTVLAPAHRTSRGWTHAAMALAASVAGIAVVGWMALGPNAQPGANAEFAQAKPAAVVARTESVPATGLQEYVLAHQANAPGLHLQGGAQHIRTVSVSDLGK